MVIEDENPYLLLTPGPLSTTPTVKRVMMRDWCTWDDDYNVDVVQVIRKQLVELAGGSRANDAAEKIFYDALGKGLSFKITMGSILTLTPPLTISQSEIDDALAILESCFKSL